MLIELKYATCLLLLSAARQRGIKRDNDKEKMFIEEGWMIKGVDWNDDELLYARVYLKLQYRGIGHCTQSLKVRFQMSNWRDFHV